MNQYKICVLFLLILTIFGVDFVNAKNEESLELSNKIIYLDPGHGGLDPGAIYKNLEEKNINLDICKILKQKLEEKGAKVYLTRYGDYDLSVKNTINRKRSDLSRRVKIINESKADLYLSIHLNSDSSSTWRGIQLFYDDINEKNKKISEILEKELKKNFSLTRKSEEVKKLYMLRRINIPGLLIEAGFLSNPNDRFILKSKNYQEKLSNIITKGIITYFYHP